MPNQVRIPVSTPGAKQSGSELDQLAAKFEKFQKQGAKGLAIGAGAAVTAGALGLVGNALGGVTDLLKESARAYIEDEKSIRMLDASLKANVPAWDGNTSAIERTLKARMELGFSDDEQRASLGKLVVATHDVNKALAVERTAMDLARFKGISLADATEALTKVEAGSFKVLKSLGIVLKDGATQTDALAAVQAAASGQAEAYAQTIEGKLLVAETKVHEAEEKFGKGLATLEAVVLPKAADAVTNLADQLDALQTGFDSTATPAAKMRAEAELLGSSIFAFLPGVKESAAALNDQADALEAATGANETDAKAVRDHMHDEDKLGDVVKVTAQTFTDQGAAIRDSSQIGTRALDDEASAADKAASAIRDYRRAVEDAFKGVKDAALDKEETSVKILENEAERADLEAKIAKGGTRVQVAEWKLRVHEILAEQLELKLHLALIGDNIHKEVALKALLTGKDMQRGLTSKNPETKSAYEALKAKILAELGLIKTEGGPAAAAAAKAILAGLGSVGRLPGGVDVTFSLATGRGGHARRLAEGGIVKAKPGGTLALLGEAGHDEAVVPLSGPDAPRRGSGAAVAVGGDTHIHINVNGVVAMTPGSAEALARHITPAIATELARRNIFARA